VKRTIALVTLVFTVCLAGQERRKRAANVNIVAAHPGVVLQYQRLGPREPTFNDESSNGIWLALRNNMTVPIYVRGFSADDRGGLALLHQVVSGNPSAGDQEVGILREETQPNAESKPSLSPIPRGYDDQHISSVIGIAPGGSLSFSFPVEHLGSHHYIRVRFVYDWELKTESREPEHYVSFRLEQVPQSERPRLQRSPK
jgi:hypothetical protein